MLTSVFTGRQMGSCRVCDGGETGKGGVPDQQPAQSSGRIPWTLRSAVRLWPSIGLDEK